MSDFRLKVIAETQEAERKLESVNKVADAAERKRTVQVDTGTISEKFKEIKTNVEEAANNIQKFYAASKKVPVAGRAIKEAESLIKSTAKATGELVLATPAAAVELKRASGAGSILSRSLRTTASTANSVITVFAKLGFTLYAVRESTNLLKIALGGLFSETVGRADRFQATLLKTQTTLASTARVYKNNEEIIDPLEKINALQGEISDRVESIRVRSIDLAGVTSNDVVEVFGMVASQISQINGNLKDAEDLAIQFSAALGTFGIPLYQARQEVGSILRGDITTDSYLAKALGITNEDVAKARSRTEGVVGFLEKRLAAAVAGQEIAAKGLEGVLSNIRDISELVSQAIGEPLLDPIIAASTALYDVLFTSKDVLIDIGTSIGNVFSDVGKRIVSAFQIGSRGEIPVFDTIKKQAPAIFETLNKDIGGIRDLINETLTRVGAALRDLFGSITAMSSSTLKAFRELLDAFIQLKLVSLESLLSAIATLAQGLTPIVSGLTEILKVWADILRTPIIQYLTQIGVTFAVLKASGVIATAAIITQLTIWAISWRRLLAKIKSGGLMIQGVIKSISTSLGSLLLLLSQVSASLKAFMIGQGADPKLVKQVQVLETNLNKAGRSAKGLAYKFRNLRAGITTLGRSIGMFMWNLIKANAVIIGVTLGITLAVDAFGRWKREVEEARQALRDAQTIDNYARSVQNLNRELTVTEQKLKDAALAAADTQYAKAQKRIEELNEEIKELNDPAAMEQLDPRGTGRSSSRYEIEKGIKSRQKEILEERKKEVKALMVLQKERDKDVIKTQQQNRVTLEKEIEQLRKQQEDTLFRKRQQLAQKEIELFRQTGELRIRQMEQANAKLIEGEEGASAAALEAFNNYLSVRERGELDIEAKKQELAVTVADLDREVADYRYETEKKITELKKRIGEFETKVADYRVQRAKEEAETRALKAGGRVGKFGDDLAGRLIGSIVSKESGGDYTIVNEHSKAIGIGQVIPSNVGPWTQKYYGKRLTPEQYRYHYRAQDAVVSGALKEMLFKQISAGYSDEMAVRRVAAEWYSGNPNLESSTRPQYSGGKEYPSISSYASDIVARMGQIPNTMPSGTTADTPPPAAPKPPQLDVSPLAGFDKSVGVIATLQNRIKRIYAQLDKINEDLTSEQRKEAFEQVAKAAFPQMQLEQYEDRLTELGYSYDALANSSADAFNPERTAIEVSRLTQIAAKSRELQQIQDNIAKRTNVTDAEKTKFLDQLNAKYVIFLKNLDKEALLKRSILSTEQATALITQLRTQTRDVYRDIEALQLRNRLEAESVAPEFITAEIAKLDIQRQVERTTRELNDQLEAQIELRDRLQAQIAGAADADKAKLQKDLDAAREELARLRKLLKAVPEAGTALAAAEDARARAATEPGTRIASFIGSAKRELKDLESAAIRVSQSIGDAIGSSISNGISGLIEGATTAEQVFSDFLKNIGQILVQEATKMIATYVAIGVARQFAGLFGFGAPSPTERGAFSIGQAATLALPSFDGGGFTGAGVRSGGLDGKGGFPAVLHPNEVVMPLERGDNSMQQTSTAQLPFTRSAESLTPAQAMQAAGPIDVRYESQVINGVEYVTAEQHRKGMTQAAERGRALTLDAIFNSPKVRRKAGL